MKLQVFEPSKTETVRILKLEQAGDEIMVVVVDQNGRHKVDGSLVKFCTDGTLYLEPGISPVLGFQLTEDRRIKLTV